MKENARTCISWIAHSPTKNEEDDDDYAIKSAKVPAAAIHHHGGDRSSHCEIPDLRRCPHYK